ncbi:MAG: hypothetical protein AAF499_13615, partial [Pseudomonadota bacterium]
MLNSLCRPAAAALALASLVGCATPAFDQARALHHGGDSQAALVYLEEAEPDIPDRDRLVLLLERGTLELYNGRFDDAAKSFVAAVDYIDDQDRISVSDEARALLSNEATKRYTGETSERLLAHTYAMLSFLLAGNPESAAVEARRATKRLESEKDTLANAQFSRAVIALTFEMAGQYNDAYVSARALPEDVLPATRVRLAQRLGSGETQAEVPTDLQNAYANAAGEVILVVSSGQVSRKYSSHLTNGIDWHIAFPGYTDYPPLIPTTRVTYDSEDTAVAERASSDINSLARESLEARAGRLLLRQGLRLTAKRKVIDELRSNDNVGSQLLAFALLVS